MIQSLLRAIFGSKNDRELKRIVPLIERVNVLEPAWVKLSDAALAAKTGEFRQRLANGETLDALLPEAFATVREASKRTLGQRHYDVQLVGGVVLHEGKIAEMKTGEGKTLVATLPAYLNALPGRGVHIVTVNDYLARRDAEWMGQVHRFLGLTVGVIVHDLSDQQRQAAYGADITYGTNNEFGFDYLRDNMKRALFQCVQRELHYAIVDEVDSILIDEARTPLIISGPSEENTQVYGVADRVVRQLRAGTKGDVNKGIEETGEFWFDEKDHVAALTEEGVRHVEKLLGIQNLYDPRDALGEPRGQPGADRAHAQEARRRLRREARRGRQARGPDRRRVHRPPDAGPPLVRRPAPGGRGQGRHPGPEREPDARDDHLPELLPHVREALGHDRHRRHRGAGVREDLRPRRAGDPDQPPDDPRGPRRRGLQDQAREVRRGRRGDQGAPRQGPADPRRHDLDRDVGDVRRASSSARASSTPC